MKLMSAAEHRAPRRTRNVIEADGTVAHFYSNSMS
jgi:hypothetical protein